METFTFPGSYREQQQKTWTTQALLERIFGQNYEQLRGQTLRMVRVRIPGREVCLAHILMPSDPCIYQNLGLHIGVHEGEDHTGEAIGMIRFTPWEAVVAAADCAMKAANVEIGFMDRFCGSLILTGRLADVETAVEEVVRFFREDLHFHTCEVTRN
ncbi:MAG: BMC domain-containing protein [Lachnospiraceae bacterium]|nr:BMC domain-containing protein [Lachnospiraceae bacterium]